MWRKTECCDLFDSHIYTGILTTDCCEFNIMNGENRFIQENNNLFEDTCYETERIACVDGTNC